MPRCGLGVRFKPFSSVQPKSGLAVAARRGLTSTGGALAKAPSELLEVKKLEKEEDHRLARQWTQGFVVDDIPKGSYETSYARSSGPGGQVRGERVDGNMAERIACEHDEFESCLETTPAACSGFLVASVRPGTAVEHGRFAAHLYIQR